MAARIVFLLAVVSAVGTSATYVGYRLGTALASIQGSKRLLGYATPCSDLPPPVFETEGWTGVLLDADTTHTDGAHNVVFCDIDRDGQVEVVANSFRSDSLMLYRRNPDKHASLQWTRYVIDPDVGDGIPATPVYAFAQSLVKEGLLGGFTGGAHYTAIDDLNGDGLLDLIVAGDLKKCDVVWYEAPEQSWEMSSWKRHAVYRNNSHRTYQVETGDIDGDDDPDIVLATKTDNSLGWLQNNGLSGNWRMTWIHTNYTRCFYARVADVDNDGRNDVVATQDTAAQGGKLYRFTYSTDPCRQEDWTADVIAAFPPGHGASVFEVRDFDQDDDVDIFVANHEGDVFLVRNLGREGRPEKWSVHRLNEWDSHQGHDFRELDVGDIDGDGDLDVVVADERLNLVLWLENPGDGEQGCWPSHIVDRSRHYLGWCHCVDLGDADGDGDLDIAVASCGGNAFLIYLNQLRQGVRPAKSYAEVGAGRSND